MTYGPIAFWWEVGIQVGKVYKSWFQAKGESKIWMFLRHRLSRPGEEVFKNVGQ